MLSDYQDVLLRLYMGNGLQAANDPIAPSRGIPREDIKVCMLIPSLLRYILFNLLSTESCLVSGGATFSFFLRCPTPFAIFIYPLYYTKPFSCSLHASCTIIFFCPFSFMPSSGSYFIQITLVTKLLFVS